jgi:hypothetical protein
MKYPLHEVSEILTQHWSFVESSRKLNFWQIRTLSAIKNCRTANMGAHVDACTDCGYMRISYNSCRNRHCPKCQGAQREEWIHAREKELLPVPYFHVVFTLPGTLNSLCLNRARAVYEILFKTAWHVVKSFGDDAKWLGAKTGMIAILHTWGQTMTLHPHLHCIVPGGGITINNKWKYGKSKGKYLFPVKAMSKVFRSKFIEFLKIELPDMADENLISQLYRKDWVVYAKRPFGGPEHVIEYLGRYTHKIAISNHRITNISEGKVTFSYKDYRHAGMKKEMILDAPEFITRFSMHILPKRFVRIRHYGILSSTGKHKYVMHLKKQLPEDRHKLLSGSKPQIYNPKMCPCCNRETMQTILHFKSRAPPENWMKTAKIMLNLLNHLH